MLLSRLKPAKNSKEPAITRESKISALQGSQIPDVQHFIDARDYSGSLTLLEFERASSKGPRSDANLWIAYCSFHTGDYEKAKSTYEEILKSPKYDPRTRTWLAACHFMLGDYEEAVRVAKEGPKNKLENRILFHASQKLDDEETLMSYHGRLENVVEDQMTLASIHYMRGHFQEAINIYKDLGKANPNYTALNIYMAMCYFKTDMFTVAAELVKTYLQQYPDSLIAKNLYACIVYKTMGGEEASQIAAPLLERLDTGVHFGQVLLQHNLAVFNNGRNALQVWPKIGDKLMEASINMALYHLRNNEPEKAEQEVKHIENPSMAAEYVTQAIVYSELAQKTGDIKLKQMAFQLYQTVGQSTEECDSPLGRQCMASCFFLLKDYTNVLLYLDSIKQLLDQDDAFLYNYAQAKAAIGAYDEAEEALLKVQDPELRAEYTFRCHLTRCFILNSKPELAWELYSDLDMSAESFSILNLIANDCYKAQEYLYALKAFNLLERYEPTNLEYWEGKRGAAAGLFKHVVEGLKPKSLLSLIVDLLASSPNLQASQIVSYISQWAKENRIPLQVKPTNL